MTDPRERVPPGNSGEETIGEAFEWLERTIEALNREAVNHLPRELIFQVWQRSWRYWHDEQGMSASYTKYRYLCLMQKAIFTHFKRGCTCWGEDMGREGLEDQGPPPPPPPGLV
ncbi:vpx protein [Human immunodeficiency virus 2]|uniref:Protein Vpx n=2 Tax=Human immunodeficiency virus 2 TaxID=11709 RepID=VPX_HV2BE|nr:vpx protein [Human immunodeficiency virus 2]P18099.1 RecName: Full=Protein Vpx; AltName: Full=Viral protein X; AltName: Full=X ORF protein [Human immunodeficiency virus type 2 (ISOLATE BEN)]AAB00739.1 vpx protein [Human immunodeficiency virus 2]QLK12532.1 vpx protein [Human immunodeficiency virus 2]